MESLEDDLPDYESDGRNDDELLRGPDFRRDENHLRHEANIIRDLRNQLAECREHGQELQAQLDFVRGDLAGTAEEVDRLTVELTQARGGTTPPNQGTRPTMRERDLQGQLGHSHRITDLLQRRIRELETTIRELHDTIELEAIARREDAAYGAVRQRDQDLENAQNWLVDPRARVVELEEQVAVMAAYRHDDNMTIDGLARFYGDDTERLESVVTELREDLLTTENARDELQGEHDHLLRLVRELAQRVEDLDEQQGNDDAVEAGDEVGVDAEVTASGEPEQEMRQMEARPEDRRYIDRTGELTPPGLIPVIRVHPRTPSPPRRALRSGRIRKTPSPPTQRRRRRR